MIKRALLLFTFLLLLGMAKASDAAEIEGLRIWPAPEKTRVVFDLSDKVDYKAFLVEKPNRLVIDFSQSSAVNDLSKGMSKNTLLKGIRSAKKQDKTYRVVFDLRRKVNLQSFRLKPSNNRGHRLVLDLMDPNIKQVVNAPDQKKELQTPTISTEEPVLRDLVVAIDAGHGGKDPGAVGKRGTKEKDVVLSIAKKLAAKVNKTTGMRAVLTRKNDKYLPLRKRIDIARANNADLFISIHADAIKNHQVQGSSVYVLSQNGASSEAARWLAEKENEADFIGGVKLAHEDQLLKEVLIDLSQNAVLDASTNIADKVLGGLKKVGNVHKPDVQHAGFVVLKSPDIPSILIETAFISNPKEERKLLDPKQQNKLASAIVSGIQKYFSEYAPPGTRLVAR